MRDCSIKIAAKIAEDAYADKTASTYPEPEDKEVNRKDLFLSLFLSFLQTFKGYKNKHVTKVKVVMPGTDFFMYSLNSQELNLDNYFTRKFRGRFSVFTFTLGLLLGFGTSSDSLFSNR